MRWNNALPGKTLSVSNEGMNFKKAENQILAFYDKWEKKVFILGLQWENHDHAINTFVRNTNTTECFKQLHANQNF